MSCQVALHRRAGIELPRVNGLPSQQGCERLGQRADQKRRVCADRCSVAVVAKPAHVHRATFVHDGQRDARNARRLPLGFDERIDLVT